MTLRKALSAAACGVAAAGMLACSGNVKSVALRPEEAGAPQYRITCDKNIERCQSRAAELCASGYQVLRSSGHQLDPERITTAPGPTSTGPNFAAPTWEGELIIECHRREAPPSAGAVAVPALTPAVAPSPVPSVVSPLPGQLCVPGATQLCLGPAACRGAQACRSDGLGYDPCDCGTAADAPGASPGNERAPADAGSPAPER